MALLCYLCAPVLVHGQVPAPAQDAPRFEIADVHPSARTPYQYQAVRVTPPRSGRYEIHTASMLDLIRTAWDIDADKVIAGPSWLEMDRFDVIAKVPPNTKPEALKEMLQSLLADRFDLKIRKDTRPLPAWVLTAERSRCSNIPTPPSSRAAGRCRRTAASPHS